LRRSGSGGKKEIGLVPAVVGPAAARNQNGRRKKPLGRKAIARCSRNEKLPPPLVKEAEKRARKQARAHHAPARQKRLLNDHKWDTKTIACRKSGPEKSRAAGAKFSEGTLWVP